MAFVKLSEARIEEELADLLEAVATAGTIDEEAEESILRVRPAVPE